MVDRPRPVIRMTEKRLQDVIGVEEIGVLGHSKFVP